MKKTVALIFGGEGYERKISEASADNLSTLIDDCMYRIIHIGIDKSGNWYIYKKESNNSGLDNWENDEKNLTPTFPIRLCGKSGFIADGEIIYTDIAIPCLHGDFGEDGVVAGALTAAHISYIGQDVYAAAMATDKTVTKLISEHLSIPVAPWILSDGDDVKAAKAKAEKKIGYPMFIKPARLGSSYGAHPVMCREDFDSAFLDARAYAKRLIIEKYINFKYEVECAFLDGDSKRFSPHGRILISGKFYDFDSKYMGREQATDTTRGFNPDIEDKIQEYSEKLCDFIGIRHLARIDFFVTDKDEVYFNEINTFPGMTKTSLYPTLTENMGLGKGEFINILIEKEINDRRI